MGLEAKNERKKTKEIRFMDLYLFNFLLIFLFIIIRFIEIYLTFEAIKLGAVEIGIIAQYNIPFTIFLTIPLVVLFIYLNYKWKKRNQDLREVSLIIGSGTLLLLIITSWNLFQLLSFNNG